ncbi:TPA: kinesin [Raoultella planticola]|uniref:kinesin n=1 Tax=Raoultella planticola TaxID=575 RepID=UPI0038161029
MEYFYKVEMPNQWRMGIGGFVDLNCGWYCQAALLSWFCVKYNIPKKYFKEVVKYNRLSYGFDPGKSFCQKITIPKDIFGYKEALFKYGPVIASGKLGSADFGILGGVEHYILIVGVQTKSNNLIICDPLSVNPNKIREAKPCFYNFNRFVARVNDTLVLNRYSFNRILAVSDI